MEMLEFLQQFDNKQKIGNWALIITRILNSFCFHFIFSIENLKYNKINKDRKKVHKKALDMLETIEVKYLKLSSIKKGIKNLQNFTDQTCEVEMETNQNVQIGECILFHTLHTGYACVSM